MNYSNLTKKQLLSIILAREPKTIISDTDKLISFLKSHLIKMKPDFSRENFFIVALSNKNNFLGIINLFQGSINSCHVIPREIFKTLFTKYPSGAGFIMVHNHPSGNMNPSKNDFELTKAIKNLGEKLDYKVFDHIIISDFVENYYSFLENDLL